MNEEERKKWSDFHKREDVIAFRAKAQLARSSYSQSDETYWNDKLMGLAESLGLTKI